MSGMQSAWQTAFNAGHELDDHTVNHPDGIAFTQSQWTTEIHNCRTALASAMGTTVSNIQGFRSPYLHYNDSTFSALLAENPACPWFAVPGSLAEDPACPWFALRHRREPRREGWSASLPVGERLQGPLAEVDFESRQPAKARVKRSRPRFDGRASRSPANGAPVP